MAQATPDQVDALLLFFCGALVVLAALGLALFAGGMAGRARAARARPASPPAKNASPKAANSTSAPQKNSSSASTWSGVACTTVLPRPGITHSP